MRETWDGKNLGLSVKLKECETQMGSVKLGRVLWAPIPPPPPSSQGVVASLLMPVS